MQKTVIGVLNVSDRASAGVYADEPGQACVALLREWLATGFDVDYRIVPDDVDRIAAELTRQADEAGCCLIVTTGGTGPAPRDVTPEATLRVVGREMPGFGELMRATSLKYVPTAILSRQTAVVRGSALILNLPGQPQSIAETLEGLRDVEGRSVVPGIFAAVPYCIDLIGGPYIDTDESVCAAFRPKSAGRVLQA